MACYRGILIANVVNIVKRIKKKNKKILKLVLPQLKDFSVCLPKDHHDQKQNVILSV